ncbi:MAG: pilus assembly protein PilP [Nitrospirae bacterium]|nr:pilus assembly protein PilP [Nitrospirota bacterium]
MKRLICLVSIIFLFIYVIAGCNKTQPLQTKPTVSKVSPVETKVEQQDTEKSEQQIYSYDPKGRRDPFLSLVAPIRQKPLKEKGLGPFERYGLDEINLLAIAWDKQKSYALIMFPDKKSYTVTEGTRLGVHGGKIEKITQDSVIIREYIKDYRGVIKPRDSILKLHKEEGG